MLLSYLPAVGSAARFQRLTGCRPGEVCSLRPGDIDISGDVWSYQFESHKNERQRVIFIGPGAQDVLRPYLLRESTARCFSPVDVGSQTPARPARTTDNPSDRP